MSKLSLKKILEKAAADIQNAKKATEASRHLTADVYQGLKDHLTEMYGDRAYFEDNKKSIHLTLKEGGRKSIGRFDMSLTFHDNAHVDIQGRGIFFEALTGAYSQPNGNTDLSFFDMNANRAMQKILVSMAKISPMVAEDLQQEEFPVPVRPAGTEWLNGRTLQAA